MIHNNSNSTKPVEKWGYWKSTKIFICIFIVFSVLFYSLLHISFIQKLIIPTTGVLSMTDLRGGSESNENSINLDRMRDQDNDRNRERSNSNSFLNTKKTIDLSLNQNGGGNMNNGNNYSSQYYEYNDNIITDPPNF